MQRDIAGQINNFSLLRAPDRQKLGVWRDLDKTFGDNWKAQLGAAPSLVQPAPARALFGGFQNADVQSANLDGNEHLGALVAGGVGGLGNLNDDLPLPAGAAFGFSFSIDLLLNALNIIWAQLTISPGNGRLDMKGKSKSDGPVELLGIEIRGNTTQDTWMTVVWGTFHTPPALPNVPFTATTTETLVVVGSGEDRVIQNERSARIDLETSSLHASVRAIEAANTIAGLLGIPGQAALAFDLDNQLESKLSGVLESAGAPLGISVLGLVARSFPQTMLIADTSEKLTFPYDAISIPTNMLDPVSGEGFLATFDSVGRGLQRSLPAGAAITVFGFSPPRLANRVGAVTVSGRESFSFPPAGGIFHSARTWVESYTAISNVDVVNPTFHWSIVHADGVPSAAAVLLSSTGQTVQVAYDRWQASSSKPLSVVVHVRMDDDLHLKDINGQQPSAELNAVASLPSGSAVAGRPTLPRPLRVGRP